MSWNYAGRRSDMWGESFQDALLVQNAVIQNVSFYKGLAPQMFLKMQGYHRRIFLAQLT